MRGFVSYLIAGILVVLALGMIAPLVALSPVGASPAVSNSNGTLQFVDRTNKGDRVPVTTVSKQKPETPRPPTLLVGCDPAFSPLAVSARANFARSCIG
ncbi:MAG TPA: hypothetical protein VK522_05780 [Pseudolabrys sp.]|jgi:hypothetical protein|nr:hypothetical protein [Pseudolabrys sp.]